MFTKWLNRYFSDPTNFDPFHSPGIVLDAQDRVISADRIKVDATTVTESNNPEQEFIDEMTTLLRRLNAILANCPQSCPHCGQNTGVAPERRNK